MATGITIDEVTNTLDDIQGTEKIPVSSGISEPEVVTTGDLKDYINTGMQEEISDLSTIRSGASAGATAYQKPSSGIPSTDLASAVQTSLGKADTALQSFTETDPTVPSWAKSSSKPSYNYSEISGTPTLANVATSGSYNDLSNKPTIPAAQVNADWNATSGVEKILNKPTIPAEQIQSDWNQSNTSAKDYIKNKPTIPVVPSNVSAFTNDAGYITSYTETDPVFSASAAHSITSTDIAAWNGKSDFSGSYNDLTDKPTIPTVPTTLSSFTDDLGSSPTHTHSQYLTAHQDISGKENTSNKVTSLSSSSTDTEYPSAKCVYDLVGDIETILASI